MSFNNKPTQPLNLTLDRQTDRGQTALEAQAERYCQARAAGRSHDDALVYAFENDRIVEKNRASLAYARWLRRRILMPRIDYLKSHSELIVFE